MWKKDEPQIEPTPPTRTGPTDALRPEAPRTRPATPGGERAAIGRSISIRGEVTGDEDLLIQGRIEGSIDLSQHSVTIGPEGRVTANISARMVTVEGQVNGDLRGTESVALRSTARVEGNIVAPRVLLEDGATFRGSIDMSAGAPNARGEKPSPRADAPTTSGPAGASPTGAGASHAPSG